MILHGSYAWGTARVESDIDVVCIHDSDHMSSERLSINGFEIDILWVREAELEQQFDRLPSENNSPLLRALAHGYVVLDRTGSVQSIRDRALSIWSEGPRVPKELESQSLRMNSLAIVRSLQHWMEQPDPDVHKERFMWLHADRVFYVLVYRYYKMHGLWTQDLRKMLAEAETNMPRFYARCLVYLETHSLTDAVTALQLLAEACVCPTLLDDA